MIRTGKLVLIPILLFLHCVAFANEVQVQATVDRTQMYTGDTFTVTVAVSSSSNVNISEPRLPNVADFDLLNSWSGTSTVSTFTNGKFQVQRTRQFNYLFAPKRVGQMKVGAFTVVANGQEYKTTPITLNIKQGTAPAQRQAKPRRQLRPPGQQRQLDPFSQMEEEMDNVFNQLLQRRGAINQAPANIDPSDEYFLDVTVDKKEAYVGEQITVSWHIYTRHSLTNIQNLKFPDLKGFWKEDIEVATNLNYSNEVINGVVYRKALLASYALFPIKSGPAVIDPYEIKCKFRMPGILQFRETDYIAKASRPLKVNVLALPVAGKPESFTGAVGSFQIQSSLGQNEFKSGEPFSLNIKFSGRGNAKRLDLPELNLPEGLQLYDSKSDSKFYKNGSSFKNFELFIIPRSEGQVEVPPLEFAFFNPETRAYYTLKSNPFNLSVEKGVQSKVIAESRVDAPMIEGQKADNLYPAPIVEWKTGFRLSVYQRSIIWTAIAIMACLILLWRGFVEFEVFSAHQTIEVDVKKRVTQLMNKASKEDWREVGIDGSNLIYFLLGELSGQGGASRQAEALIDLCPPSIRRELGKELLTQLNDFEELAFAPEEVVQAKTDTKKLKARIKSLEKLCKSTIKLAASEKA